MSKRQKLTMVRCKVCKHVFRNPDYDEDCDCTFPDDYPEAEDAWEEILVVPVATRRLQSDKTSPERARLLAKLACRGVDDPSPEQMVYLIRALHDALCREGVSLKYHRSIAEARIILDWATDGAWRRARER